MERGNIWDFGGPWLACSDVLAIQQQQHNHRFTAIIQVDLCYELVDFVGAKFYCPHALADGNQCIQIREKTLEFSSTVGCQCYLQCYLYCLRTSHVSVSLMYLLYSRYSLWDNACSLVVTHLTCQTSVSCWRMLTINCLTIRITHCTSYFHHNLQHHRTITSDAASMTDNCMNTKDTWVTVIL